MVAFTSATPRSTSYLGKRSKARFRSSGLWFVQHDARFELVEQVGDDRVETARRQALGHLDHGGVDAEDLLDHHDRGAWPLPLLGIDRAAHQRLERASRPLDGHGLALHGGSFGVDLAVRLSVSLTAAG